MGFKLKKKNTAESASKKNGSAFFAKIQAQIELISQMFGDSKKTRPIIYSAIIFLFLSTITLIYLFYSVPRNNELTRSLGQLRLLSQTIPRQATESTASGSPEAIASLKKSQEQFAQNLENVQDIYGASSEEFKKVDQLWKNVSTNVDLITSQQKLINQLYDTNIAIGESIPGIQAEYNLMVDQMARLNMPSSQVVIAKNQVFIAERILRSISSVLVGTENARASADDFSADIETFGAYLNAQLNGSADLGVERISDPSLRESVDSIKSEYDEVLKTAASTVFKNANQIVKVRQASSQIFSQSDDMLKSLNNLSDKADSGWSSVIPAVLLLLFLTGFILSVARLLAIRNLLEKNRVTRLQDEYDRNQNAILRLLDEIADLADGDLRSYATVSEDFTGAIADSINFAIDQLRCKPFDCGYGYDS